jgi:hypothetical protein
MEQSNYNILVGKLDQFIRKYYKNQLIKGLIYSVSAVLLFYISVVTFEYFGHFEAGVRAGLFYSFIGITGAILAGWVIRPIFKLNRLGKTISHEQAASIIGIHFVDIKDKLLNTLQLQELATEAPTADRGLIEASINQRIVSLTPVPFTAAIDFSRNKKYLKYAIAPVALLMLLLFVKADIITDGTERLFDHNTEFEAVVPFEFILTNDELSVVEQEDYALGLRLKSDLAVPDNVYIEVEGNQFRLTKENNVNFNYLFKNVQKDTRFRFYADGYYSEFYDLSTLPNPTLINFDIGLEYPKYIGKTDEVIRNSGNLVIPAGTKVKWNFRTKNTDNVRISFSDSSYTLSPEDVQAYAFAMRFFKNKSYSVATQNEFVQSRDSILYSISVIPDNYPQINVDERADSMSTKRVYFTGDIKDDYGFKRLSFNYRFVESEDSTRVLNEMETVNVPFNVSQTQDQFFHFWDLNMLEIKAGEEIEYYFEVWDNDGINGSKSSRSATNLFQAPTLEELSDQEELQNEDMKERLEDNIEKAKELQEEIDELQEELMDKKNMNWQLQQKAESMLKQQQELMESIEEMKEQNQQNNSQQNEYKPIDPKVLEKQMQLERLFEDIMTPEMKELFEELEKLLEELDKDEIQEELEQLDLNNEDMEKELDRTLELFKQMEFEMKLEETIEKLDKIAEEQEELSEQSKDKDADQEVLKEKQAELNEEFEELKEDLEDLEEKNEDLENERDMEDTEEQEEQISEDMKESSEKLEEEKNKKASESQKDAAEQMQEMSEQLQAMQQQQSEQSMQEDMDALRGLLENLIQISFDQEDLMAELGGLSTKDPKYRKLGQVQKKLKDDARIIEDSLFALSKRIVQLESTVNREIASINNNMDKSIAMMAERKTGNATGRQQLAMTSMNNLALLLDDALQQMQNQMASKMPGTGQCQKPGGKSSNPSAGDMAKMQEKLKKQIEELKKGAKGSNPGEGEGGEGQEPGKKGEGKGSKPGMSKQLAKMAAEQEALRRAMQQKAGEMNGDGSGDGNELKEIAKEMEENEEDILNGNFDLEMMERQQDIMSRLLEAEKAERQREFDEKREAEEAKNYEFSNPDEFFEYKEMKEKEVELLKTVPPSLKRYYKNKVNQYFNSFSD